MMTIEKTARELRRRIKAAGFREITLTMACNGDKVTVSPCYSGCGTPASFDQVEYYLIYSPSLPWLGGDTLESVAGQLNSYSKRLKEAEVERRRLNPQQAGDGADGLRRVGGAVFLLFRFLQGRLRTSPV